MGFSTNSQEYHSVAISRIRFDADDRIASGRSSFSFKRHKSSKASSNVSGKRISLGSDTIDFDFREILLDKLS